MLLQFKVSNFRSIGEEQALSLGPSENQKEYPENILTQGNYNALGLIGIYGPNGSGKSNVLKAFARFFQMIKKSSKGSSSDKLNYDPFLLRKGWETKPTCFEIVFILKEKRYRYGFSYNERDILEEYLFRKTLSREVSIFQRSGDTIDVSSSLKANAKIIDASIEATRDNGLFLSAMDSLNIKEANDIFKMLKNTIYIDGNKTSYLGTMPAVWEDGAIQKMVKKHFTRLQLGPVDLKAEAQESVGEEDKRYKIFAEHIYFDENGQDSGKTRSWDFLKRESSGTIKALELASPILIALAIGGILTIDEIEANMHPLLTLDTINLFLSKDTNPKGAQLIFTTHDTNLLSYSKLRRDQIYFAEKNRWNSTELYSLSDFVYLNEDGTKAGKERPDSDKEKRYIEGRYGAIPVLGRMTYQDLEEKLNQENG